MYQLFELSRLLTVGQSGGCNRPTIQLSAYAEIGERSLLALVCSNGYILLYYSRAGCGTPTIRQVPWIYQPQKKIKALCFDPSGTWLLLASADATLYIFPALSIVDPSANVNHVWNTDDVTEIRLSGHRATPTSVKWWHTFDSQPIAVMGNELGEISFVNLKTWREISGTYVMFPVHDLDVLHDNGFSSTYLLITGSNNQHWCCLLEEENTGSYWMMDSRRDTIGRDALDKMTWEDTDSSSSDERHPYMKPYAMAKFDSQAILTPQYARGHYSISAYHPTLNQLQVLENSLQHTPLFSYRMPPSSASVVLADKLLFVLQRTGEAEDQVRQLTILSRQFAEIPDGHKKRDKRDAEVQSFTLPTFVKAIYKRSSSQYKMDVPLQNGYRNTSAGQDVLAFHREVPKVVPTVSTKGTTTATALESTCPSYSSCNMPKSPKPGRAALYSGHPMGKRKVQREDFMLRDDALDGCILIAENEVYECRPRISPEKLFVSLTDCVSDLPQAERLGVMLGLDINRLYEAAADVQLAAHQFSQAVRLYQLSKCPQLKRVAHFVSYGYMSELIAYIQVLFTTKGNEIAVADRGHFANIAVHCFVQQVLEKKKEKPAMTQAFREFLQENLYYDEHVGIRLLAEQGLHDLLHFCTHLRGQQCFMLEHLLSSDRLHEAFDEDTQKSLEEKGYEGILLRLHDGAYLRCITSPELLQHLVGKPQLHNTYLRHLAHLLPELGVDLLQRVVHLYDPFRLSACLVLRKTRGLVQNSRYWSASTLTSSDAPFMTTNQDEVVQEQDIVKFFIVALLMLNHRRRNKQFHLRLLDCDIPCDIGTVDKSETQVILPTASETSIACGVAHVAFIRAGVLYTWGKTQFGRLGCGSTNQEQASPTCIELFRLLPVKVLQVSCGALHTLAITDHGVFGWGSSQYGQLGMEDLQHCNRPLLHETLSRDVVFVDCGQYHSLACTDDGRVFSFGWGVHGQLGHGNTDNLHVPVQIHALEDEVVVSASGGSGHTVVLTQKGNVYTFGCGIFGQLGLGSTSKWSTPQQVALGEPAVLLASRYFHTIVVTKSNKIYTWGCNPQSLRLQAQSIRRARQQAVASQSQGQEQFNPTEAVVPPPTCTHLLPSLVDTSCVTGTISQISCGSHHFAALTEMGELYTWGRNVDGQLGQPGCKDQKFPNLVSALATCKIMTVACGGQYTLAVDSLGRVWGWGQNDCGQLGSKSLQETGFRGYSGALGSGRTIMIRTNRRMIAITQGRHQGEHRPVEITTIPPVNTGTVNCDTALDSISFSSEHMKLHDHTQWKEEVHWGTRRQLCNQPCLANLDDPPYGSRALHVTLKLLHNSYDFTSVLNHCVGFGDFQAAAKISILEGLCTQATEHQFRALTLANIEAPKLISTALHVAEFYIRNMEQENCEENKKLLEHVILFWMDNQLPVEPLEALFRSHLSILMYPLSLLLFCEGIGEVSNRIQTEFVSRLSTSFCLTITSGIVKHVDCGKPHEEWSAHMMRRSGTGSLLHQIRIADTVAGWEPPPFPHRLWHEVLGNLRKGISSHARIRISPGEVERLCRATGDEVVPPVRESLRQVVPPQARDDHIVVFSCGHNFTLHAFWTAVLPDLEQAMKKLPVPLPQTTQTLVSCYQTEGVIPAACPNCAINEISKDL